MVTHNPAGGIVLSRLSKSYGTVRAVQAVDLAIGPGETVALLGPNGEGKSTTIDMILGLARPDTGTVSVFGQSPEAATGAGGAARLALNAASAAGWRQGDTAASGSAESRD
jgi:ABC-2 type transport system ATP-binding protein